MRGVGRILAAALLLVSTLAPAALPAPSRVSLDSVIGDDAASADSRTALVQWAWRRTLVDRAWDAARGSPQIVVATIDTGVDLEHPDLADVVLPGATFTSSLTPGCTADDQDDNSHGTHVAGIIAATGRDAASLSGVAFGVRILPIKALDCAGSGTTSDIARGVKWATDHGARVINVSLGTRIDAPALADAVRYALDHDVLVVAAAGNCGAMARRCAKADAAEYPAAYPGVLAVGATDSDDAVAAFSTRGGHLALAAPGVGITSTTPGYATYLSLRGVNPGHAAFTGTSQSSAIVAGIAALVWSARPSLSAWQISTILTSTSDDLGAPGRDDSYGFGRVNALRAVERAISFATPAVTPIP